MLNKHIFILDLVKILVKSKKMKIRAYALDGGLHPSIGLLQYFFSYPARIQFNSLNEIILLVFEQFEKLFFLIMISLIFLKKL